MRSGSVKWNVAPWPGSLSSHIRPPISVTRRDAIESPRPVPPNCRVIDPSACVNASKIACCFSRGMPMPVSATRTCSTTSASRCSSMPTCTATEPSRVNFTALPIRLVMIWPSRPPSPTSRSGSAGDTS